MPSYIFTYFTLREVHKTRTGHCHSSIKVSTHRVNQETLFQNSYAGINTCIDKPSVVMHLSQLNDQIMETDSNVIHNEMIVCHVYTNIPIKEAFVKCFEIYSGVAQVSQYYFKAPGAAIKRL